MSRQKNSAHHFGVEVVYVPTTAADMPPSCFAFGDSQLHSGATHPAKMIFCFLRFWWEWSLAGSADFCVCSDAWRPEPRLSAMVCCDQILRGLHSERTPAKLIPCTQPAARGLDERLQVKSQACGNKSELRANQTRRCEAPGTRAMICPLAAFHQPSLVTRPTWACKPH